MNAKQSTVLKRIYEVTAWRGGIFGAFALPRITYVWAATPSEALKVSEQNAVAANVKIAGTSVAPAREQDPLTYGLEVTTIVNLPMSVVEQTWDRLNLPKEQRTWRPAYVHL